MKIGLSVDETYSGPRIDALEFQLGPDNLAGHRRREILTSLAGAFAVSDKIRTPVSANLPTFMPAGEIIAETAFNRESMLHVSYFTAHVTRRTPYQHWDMFGWSLAADFKPVADRGYGICLDLGHILYSQMFKAKEDAQWREQSEREFEAFLALPIKAAQVHTVDKFKGVDHMLDGFDIGPWVRKLVEKFPDITLVVESDYPQFTVEDKIQALWRWLTAPAVVESEPVVETTPNRLARSRR